MTAETKFQMWVAEFGARELADAMTRDGATVTVRAVYEWLRGQNEPRGKKLRSIVRLSSGRLTFEDLAAHFQKLADDGRRAKA
jgi:hypothetical protein